MTPPPKHLLILSLGWTILCYLVFGPNWVTILLLVVSVGVSAVVIYERLNTK